ncbi:MAG TPA: nuclear transport factor 2 family protein [Iamia sp.]
MTDPSPVEVVRGIYAAMHARDIAAVLAVVSPDLVLTQDPRLPWGGRYEGPDGFATFGLTLVENIDSAVTIDAIFEADDEVVQMGRTKGTVRSNGVAFDIAEVHRWVIRDGLAVRAHFAIDTPAMLDALGS